MFTDRARNVVTLAAEEADLDGRPAIGTGDILTALPCAEGIAARVLKHLGFSAEAFRRLMRELDSAWEPGSIGEPDFDTMPFSTAGSHSLRLAVREAQDIGHSYVGTQHILLALLRQSNCIAYQLLTGDVGNVSGVFDELVAQMSWYTGEGIAINGKR